MSVSIQVWAWKFVLFNEEDFSWSFFMVATEPGKPGEMFIFKESS